MKALLGRKIGMTQLLTEQGEAVPVTLVQAGPCVVTQVKTHKTDGYDAVQIGFGSNQKLNKAQSGHLKSASATSRYLREVRLREDSNSDEQPTYKVGDKIDISQFQAGDKINVSGVSRGKGFAGTIKRYNFSRGPKTHGSSSYRRPGSIGSMYPQKVFKGKKMAGRMGHTQVTTSNLTVAEVDTTDNLLAIRGAVPGPKRGLVLIKEAV